MGIPILVNPSWFLSLLLIVSLLSLQVLPDFSPGRTASVYWIVGLIGGLIFFLSVVLHELGHCVVARRYGLPVTSITLFIFGGVSQIAREPARPKVETLMAGAGPAVSVLIGACLLVVRHFLVRGDNIQGDLLTWLGAINLALAVFNLLPGFPLDGGRLFRSAIWGITGNFRLATRVAGWLGRGMAFALIALGLLMTLNVQIPALGSGPLDGLWLILIGMFLNSAAGQTQMQSRVLDSLRGFHAGQLLTADVPIVHQDATIRSIAYDTASFQSGAACFVSDGSRMVGLLPRERISLLPAEAWSSVTAGALMIPADRINPVRQDVDGAAILQRLDAEGLSALPVVADGAVVGLVTRAGLMQVIQRQLALKPARS